MHIACIYNIHTIYAYTAYLYNMYIYKIYTYTHTYILEGDSFLYYCKVRNTLHKSPVLGYPSGDNAILCLFLINVGKEMNSYDWPVWSGWRCVHRPNKILFPLTRRRDGVCIWLNKTGLLATVNTQYYPLWS